MRSNTMPYSPLGLKLGGEKYIVVILLFISLWKEYEDLLNMSCHLLCPIHTNDHQHNLTTYIFCRTCIQDTFNENTETGGIQYTTT